MAQLVEHHLAKVRVAGSSPVIRSGDWRSGSALPRHGRGHWFDPSIAHHQTRRRPGFFTPSRKSAKALYFLLGIPCAYVVSCPSKASSLASGMNRLKTAGKGQVKWGLGASMSNATLRFLHLSQKLRKLSCVPSGTTHCGCGSVGRASPCQGEGRGYESRHPL